MAIEFKLPEVSEGVESADVAELKVSEGDIIKAGQAVLEVETDKAVAEIECPHAGRVAKIHVAEGDTIPIGAVLLTIEESGAETGNGEATPQEPAATAPSEPSEPAQSSKASGNDSAAGATAEEERPVEKTPAASPAATVAKSGNAGKPSDAEMGNEPPPPAGPATRRLARELGVDLHQVSGSGSGGRITAEDVQAYVRTLTSGGGSASGGGPAVAPPLPDFSQFGSVERQKLNKIARSAAANLTMCWQVIPHVTQHDLVDITDLEAARKRYGQTVGQNGPKVTMTAIVIKAVVASLKAFPNFNSSLDPQTDELVLKQYYNIGVAVDTPSGLLVPVVRDADRKTVVEIAGELTEMAEKARNRKLELSAMQGATFTITNLGGIGGSGFTPIVNYPEVAILGMSRSRKELRMVDGKPEERLMMPLSLSYDHRVVNGADAARFVVHLGAGLSDVFRLLVQC